MTIHLENLTNCLVKFTKPRRGFVLALGLGLGLAATAQGWTTLALPNLQSTSPHFGAIAAGHLPDGRLLYGNDGQLYVQNTFGAAALTALPAVPGSGVDPSFLLAFSATSAFAGGGGFGNTSVYGFNPAAGAGAIYSTLDTLQNFEGAPGPRGGLYITGEDGTGGVNAVTYVAANGAAQLLVDQVSTYSAGLDTDSAGDLFVADNDNLTVYEFTAAQLEAALAGHKVLTLANGKAVHTFATDVLNSLVVDDYGRIWCAGFGDTGVFWWDPAQNQGGSFTPQGATGAYEVEAFKVGKSVFISYIWQSGYDPGDTVVYGYDLSTTLLTYPVMVTPPVETAVRRWQPAKLSVSAVGQGTLKYAWRRNGQNVKNSSNVSGAKTATLRIKRTTQAEVGRYQVVVTNTGGKVVSAAVKLKIK